MKRIKKMVALMMAAIMVLAMSMTAFAQEISGGGGDASITIKNPAKGETYSIYKLFDATVGTKGEIAYKGTVPAGLTEYFEKNEKTEYITPKANIVGSDGTTTMTPELKAALETWARAQSTPTASTDSDGSNGSALTFTNIPYGYYVMITSHKSDGQDAKSLITVASTQPDAEIIDKNENEPSADKTVDKKSYSIGDTITYTATFGTTNYMTVKEDNLASLPGSVVGDKLQVINYEISDTLPDFLSDVKVTSITIGGDAYTVNNEVPQFDNMKKIVIPWAEKEADGSYTSLYKQGAQIVVKYTAVLTSTTNINANDTNEVSILPYVDRGGNNPDPWSKPWKDTAEIVTYAAAIQKIDATTQEALPGAEFTIAGLTVEQVEDAETGEPLPGVYKVVSYDSESAVAGTQMGTDPEGKLYILGLADDVKLVVTEEVAPDGYNRLDGTTELSPQVLTKEIVESGGTRYYDKDGNLVNETSTFVSNRPVDKNLGDLDAGAIKIKNNRGSLLPSTGGIGTTIFYIVGAILVIGAGVILVTKKRMSKEV